MLVGPLFQYLPRHLPDTALHVAATADTDVLYIDQSWRGLPHVVVSVDRVPLLNGVLLVCVPKGLERVVDVGRGLDLFKAQLGVVPHRHGLELVHFDAKVFAVFARVAAKDGARGLSTSLHKVVVERLLVSQHRQRPVGLDGPAGVKVVDLLVERVGGCLCW